jgi:hypothetical protein
MLREDLCSSSCWPELYTTYQVTTCVAGHGNSSVDQGTQTHLLLVFKELRSFGEMSQFHF